MAGKQLSITYVGDASKVIAAQKQIDAGHTKMQGGVNKTSNAFKSSFGSVIPLAAAGAALAVVKFAKDTIMAAADLGEQTSRAGVQFGDASDAVIAFGKNSASSFGIANAEALAAASGFGAMTQSAGLSEQASADMSIELVKLAADMASFNNQDPSEMLEKLRSGLAGEAEPLRQFGVFISEATVKTEAYASGIAVAGEELTDAQKIQARYNVIFAQTTKQQGDFARTADSLPNQLRIMSAEWTDLSAELGAKFLPIMVEIVKTFRVIMPLLGAVADNLDVIIGVLAAFAAAKFLPELLFKIALGLQAVGSIAVANVIGALAVGLTALAPQIALLAGTAILLGIELGRLADNTWRLNETVDGTASRFGTIIPIYSAATNTTKDFTTEVQRLEGASRNYSDAVGEAAQKTHNFAHLTDEALEKFRQTAQESFASAVDDIAGFERQWGLTSNAAVRNMQDMADKSRVMARDLKRLDTEAVPEEFKAWLIQQGPDAVHAFVTANKQGKKDIVAAWREIQDNLRAIMREIRQITGKGGRDAGDAFATGLASGIRQGQPWITDAARDVAQAAVDAAKDELQSGSPSRVMFKAGEDFSGGLARGITSGENEVVQAAEHIIQQAARAAEKQLDEALDRLQKIRSRAREFAGDIAGGFESFLDISGAFELSPEEIAAFFAAQLAGAQQFAAVLAALAAQGLNKELLAQIAAAGPEALGFAQGLLQLGPEGIEAINKQFEATQDLIKETTKQLTEKFFGEKINELIREVRRLRKGLVGGGGGGGKEEEAFGSVPGGGGGGGGGKGGKPPGEGIDPPLSFGGGGGITVVVNVAGSVHDKQDLARTIRDELVQMQRRNVTTGIR